MNNKSVGLKIFLWVEIIVSIRVLLFSIPVLISKYSAQTLVWANSDDRFIGVLSLAAALYFLVGIASIVGFKLWKAAHYLAVIVVLAASMVAFKLSGDMSMIASKSYAVPLLGSIFTTVFVSILAKAKKA